MGDVHVAVGTEVSILTVFAMSAAAGPVFVAVSSTPLAASLMTTEPVVEHVTETVMDEEVDADDGVAAQPVAVLPVKAKSAAAIPDTGSLNVSVYTNVVDATGLDGLVHVAVGEVASILTEVASASERGPLPPCVSMMELAVRRATTVPSEVQVTDTLNVLVAVDDAGVKTQPAAVPALEKSADEIPETDSVTFIV